MSINGEPFDHERLSRSLKSLATDFQLDIKPLVDTIGAGLYDGLTTRELLTLTAETAATMATRHPDYARLAARVSVKDLYRQTPDTFSESIARLREYKSHSRSMPLISEQAFKTVQDHKEELDAAIKPERDLTFSYFGLQTLIRSYFLRINSRVAERPQYMFMRVAVGIHGNDIPRVLETYELMSRRMFIHATPTLFNAALPDAQLSSCFVVAMEDDSIEGIFDTLSKCAKISKYAGGIGLHVSNIRAQHSYIAGTNGSAAGLVPMLRVFNNMARYVDQGGNKRPGAISITLEPWHADVFAFLDLKKNHGKEEYRARDLFYALWIPDLFMEKVKADEPWYLFSPDTAPGLSDVYGKEFEKLYNQYVDEGRFVRSIKAQDLWSAIVTAQIETGNPSILYKDACNEKSNQKNLGTIKSSNLCTEIVEYSSPTETAVCNLASIGLPSFVDENGDVDYSELHRISKVILRNLNRIIDINFYPSEECRTSNMDNRPVAIGVQGLAEVYFKQRVPFDSPKAAETNKRIFETIYHGALEASLELAKETGHYKSFKGSPLSNGQFQFDLWKVEPSTMWDWDSLRSEIKEHGVANSLVTAVMPTASTSQILGFTECIEPITSNIYSRRVLSGEFQVVNSYLVRDLEKLGLWTDDIRGRIVANNGSVQAIDEIPSDLKDLYRTVWEISQRAVIDQSAARGAYVDQSQSLNIFLQAPTKRQLTSMHFYGWKRGLKTGIYYLRALAAAAATPVTLDYNLVKRSRAATPAFDAKRFKETPDAPTPSLCETPSSSCDVCSA